MKKGFVFISGAEIVLRFFSSVVFEKIEKEYDLTYVILQSGELTNQDNLRNILTSDNRRVELIPFYPGRFIRWEKLFDISCVINEHKSSSFAIRNNEQKKQNPLWFKKFKKIIQAGNYNEYRESVEKYMGLHPDILELTMREQPDFFILPSSLLDYITDDVLQIADKVNIPTLLLVSGWDNLSSKGLLFHKPKMIGVWGEQSYNHAVEIQGIDSNQVHLIGAPHYEYFYKKKPIDGEKVLRKSWKLPETGHLILFAGTFRLFDETQLLKDIEMYIESKRLPSFHIIYRPHPWRAARQDEDNFYSHSWQHVSMDPEMVETYKAAKEGKKSVTPNNFLFRMNHLVTLYQLVDAVVCPMSTVLLESIQFGLPSMPIAFSDGKHSWSADKVAQMYHFKEFYDVPNLVICRNRENLFSDLHQLISQIDNLSFRDSLRRSANYFVFRNQQSYSERLSDLVERMLSNSKISPNYDSTNLKLGKRFLIQNLWSSSIVGKIWKKFMREYGKIISKYKTYNKVE